MPTRARIEESDFCLTEPENWSVRKHSCCRVTEIDASEDWFKEVSLFLKDQSPSIPTTQFPHWTR